MRTEGKKLDTTAVSAVIGVIIMVAITVAMAAVAYAYFTGMIGGNNKPAPVIQFIADETTDRITVVQTDPNVPWSDFQIRANRQSVTYSINSEIGATGGTPLPLNQLVTISTATTINPTDFIDLEGFNGVAGVSVSDVTITLVHKPTSTELTSLHFQTIDPAS